MPFAKWGGSLAGVSSLDVAEAVTRRALADRSLEPAQIDEVMLGWSVPQPDIFYGTPSLAARLGAVHVSGPMLSQSCHVGGTAACGGRQRAHPRRGDGAGGGCGPYEQRAAAGLPAGVGDRRRPGHRALGARLVRS